MTSPGILSISRDLRARLWRDDMLAILAPLQCGWSDGGCHILANAMTTWLGSPSEIVALADAGGHTQHILVRCGAYYLDGDGVSTAITLLSRWRNLEHVVDPRIIPFNPADTGGIPINPGMSAATTRLLSAWGDGASFAAALTDL